METNFCIPRGYHLVANVLQFRNLVGYTAYRNKASDKHRSKNMCMYDIVIETCSIVYLMFCLSDVCLLFLCGV